MRRKKKVKTEWSPNFAYALGLLATDGNLSPDGRHLSITSKDKEQIENFKRCLNIQNKIGRKARAGETNKKYYVVQFGDISFYEFLLKSGFISNKSKVIGELDIAREYFFDFLRGHFDGDGTFYSYFDPRWKSSFMFYTVLISASKKHLLWLRGAIFNLLGITGHITKNGSIHSLRYAKAESLKLLPKLYYNKSVICLSRKRRKIERALKIAGKKL